MAESHSTPALVSQYQYELDTWSRLISFQRDELVYCKNRLAEVVNGNIEEKALQEAENLQEAFLAQERIIRFLSGALQHQYYLLQKERYFDGNVMTPLVSDQKKLRREVEKGEASFSGIKARFEQFLTEHFWMAS